MATKTMTGPHGQVMKQTYTATITMPANGVTGQCSQQGSLLENLKVIDAILELRKAGCIESRCIKALLQSIVVEM